MSDIRSSQDVSLKDELSGEVMKGVNQGNNVNSTNLFAIGIYGQYNAVLPTITTGNYTNLQTDINGRLITTSVSSAASHVIIDDATNPGTEQTNLVLVGASKYGLPVGIFDVSGNRMPTMDSIARRGYINLADTTNAFYGAGVLGNNVARTNINASVPYGQYQTTPRPLVTANNFSPLQIDNSGRLVITSEQGGPSLHIIVDDAKNPLLFQAEVHPDNYLKTKSLGAPVLYDNFASATGLDTAKWLYNSATGGTYIQQNNYIQFDTTSTSGSLSQMISRGFWEFYAASSQTMFAHVRFSASQPANNYKLWGMGSAENDGVFFKLTGTTLQAISRFNGSETPYTLDLTNVPTVLTDGYVHEYKIILKDTDVFWYIDGYNVYIARATTSDLFRYNQMKFIIENINTGASTASTLYLHNMGLYDDSTQQVILGRSNLGLRVTNEMLVDNVAYSVVNGGSWLRVLTYQIPGPNIAEIMAMRSANSTSSGRSRCISRIDLATYAWTSGSPGTFTDQNVYTQPRYASAIEGLLTVASGGGADVIVTITYTNQSGVAGRTATITVPKSSAIGSRFIATLQAGDIGVLDITAVSHSGNNTGTLQLFGTTELARHQHNTADVVSETVFAKESVMLAGNDIIDLEVWQGNAGSYIRFISVIYTIS